MPKRTIRGGTMTLIALNVGPDTVLMVVALL